MGIYDGHFEGFPDFWYNFHREFPVAARIPSYPHLRQQGACYAETI
jgi:hypothetical protein